MTKQEFLKWIKNKQLPCIHENPTHIDFYYAFNIGWYDDCKNYLEAKT